jgi:hypothetical protein
MPWRYSQTTGVIARDGTVLTPTAYSGDGPGKNNPAAQSRANIGPIPVGTWRISAPFPRPHSRRYTLRLTPQSGTTTFGRSGFMIHGDSKEHTGHASNGCIITSAHNRQVIWSSGDHMLVVTP